MQEDMVLEEVAMVVMVMQVDMVLEVVMVIKEVVMWVCQMSLSLISILAQTKYNII